MLIGSRSPVRGWRPALVLVLLAGVLGMHSLASMGMSEMAAPYMTPAAVAAPASSGPAVVGVGARHEAAATGATQVVAGGVGAQDHGVMHQCLAVLSTVLLLALVLLAVAAATPGRAGVSGGAPRWPWGRAPPWTVPSLAELSVLRV